MKNKEEILKEFDELNETLIGKEYTTVGRLKNKLLLNDSIAQTREETIREVENVLYEAMDMGYSKRDIIDKINKLKK